MHDFDTQLKKALQREKPGGNFRARVLARVGAEQRRGARPWTGLALRWAVGLVMVTAFIGLPLLRHEQLRREQGRAARQQALLALRVAGAKIHLAQTRVRQTLEQ